MTDATSVPPPPFPLSINHRDACMRAMHLIPKRDKDRVEQTYQWLWKLDEQEQHKEGGSKKPNEDADDSLNTTAWMVSASMFLFRISQAHAKGIGGTGVASGGGIPILRTLLKDALAVQHLLCKGLGIGKEQQESKGSNEGEEENEDDAGKTEAPSAAASLSVLSTIRKLLALLQLGSATESLPSWMAKDDADKKFIAFSIGVLEAILCTTIVLAESWTDWGYCWDSVASFYTRAVCDMPMAPEDGMNQAEEEEEEEDFDEDEAGEKKAKRGSDRTVLLQRLVWKMACYRSHVILQQETADSANAAGSGMPTRRQRMLASCGAVTLMTGLSVLASKAGESSKNEEREEEEPEAKRPRLDIDEEDAIQSVLSAANGEKSSACFSRWMSVVLKKDDQSSDMTSSLLMEDLTRSEIQEEMLKLADQVIQLTKVASAMQTAQNSSDEQTSSIHSACSLPDWLMPLADLLQSSSVRPSDAYYYMPSTVRLLYHSTREAMRHKHTATTTAGANSPAFDAKSIAYLDEASLIDMDSLDPLLRADDVDLGGDDDVINDENDEQMEASKEKLKSLLQPRRELTPPLLTECMELNEWTVSLLYLELVKPNRKLRAMLCQADNIQQQKGKEDNSFMETDEASAASSSKVSSWKEIVVPYLNETLLRLSQEHSYDETVSNEEESQQPLVHILDTDARVVVSGDVTPEKQLFKAAIALYYHALEAVLYCESVRTSQNNSKAMTDIAAEYHAIHRLVFHASFHEALMACCVTCVVTAIGATQKLRPNQNMLVLHNMRLLSILQICQCDPFDFLRVSETFVRSLTRDTARNEVGSPLVFGLPRRLVNHVQQTEVLLLDSVVWTRNLKVINTSGSFPKVPLADRVERLKDKMQDQQVANDPEEIAAPPSEVASWWPPEPLASKDEEDELAGVAPALPKARPPTKSDGTAVEYAEYRFLSYLFRRVLKLAKHRVRAMCDFLGVPPHFPVVAEVVSAFRYFLRTNVELLYERHLDHWMLCCLYGVIKTFKTIPEATGADQISFSNIIDAYIVVRGQELGDVTCQRVVRHIKITRSDMHLLPESSNGNAKYQATSDNNGQVGNVIMLYNRVFVPTMKRYLTKSKSIKAAALLLEQLMNDSGGGGELLEADDNIRVSLCSPEAQLSRLQLRLFPSNKMQMLTFGKPQSNAVAQANELAAV